MRNINLNEIISFYLKKESIILLSCSKKNHTIEIIGIIKNGVKNIVFTFKIPNNKGKRKKIRKLRDRVFFHEIKPISILNITSK